MNEQQPQFTGETDAEGRRQGPTVIRHPGGATEEGDYVNGLREGKWVVRNARNSLEQEGPYVSGKKHGQWMEFVEDDHRRIGHYEHGERNGEWVLLSAGDVVVQKGPYVNGKKHGDWMERSSTFVTEHLRFVHGELQAYRDDNGQWVEERKDRDW